MHDLHEANKIIKVILEQAQKNNLHKITKLKLTLGDLMEHGELIKPANLKFNLRLLAKNTLAEGLTIDIKSITGHTWTVVSIEGK
ncbi:MAG: hydrogenase/urease maturation nickel metallochaperone HypA [Candidatus Buchananbacteria bacterium]